MGSEGHYCKWCGREDGTCDCQERIDCDKAGEPGHWYCGWCLTHGCPRFECGCQRRKEAATS